jgi:hypothetical protein
VKAPSSKILAAVAFISVLGTAAFEPEVRRIPVVAPDGSVVTGPDGSVVTRPGISASSIGEIAEQILFFVCFLVFAMCTIWLLGRLLRFLYDRWKYRRKMV